MQTKTTNKSATIIINLPLSLKKQIDKATNKGNRTKYILNAIEASLKKEKLKSWVNDYLNSPYKIKIAMPDRNWATNRFYSPKK